MPRWGRFLPHWCVSEFHDSAARSCWRMRSFWHPVWEKRRKSGNLPGRFQGTEPPLESVWHRHPSHHKPAFWPALRWVPARFRVSPLHDDCLDNFHFTGAPSGLSISFSLLQTSLYSIFCRRLRRYHRRYHQDSKYLRQCIPMHSQHLQ